MVVVVANVKRVVAAMIQDTSYMSFIKNTPGVKPIGRVLDEQSR